MHVQIPSPDFSYGVMETRIPLIEDLTSDPLPPGSSIIVEYDPAAQWYPSSLTIAAGWMQSGGKVSYHATGQAPEKVRTQLKLLGLDSEELERDGKLEIWDWYTAMLGRKPTEKLAIDSLKVVDLSIWWSKHRMVGSLTPEVLRVIDDMSSLARYNDEKSWVDFMVTRIVPSAAALKSTRIVGIIKGIHSEWAYKTLEAAHDGIIDLKLEEAGEETRALIRVRSMRNVSFDRRWHRLNFDEKFNATVEKATTLP